MGVEEAEAVNQVLESGWLAEGTKTREFERAICDFVGCDYAVAVTNATVGLELCLRALEIRGRVAVPAFGHPATVRAILNSGCEPVFVDVDLETYNVNTNKIVMGGYFGIPVSWGGNPLTLDVGWVDENKMIEDAACSLGTGKQYNFPRVFSFHPRKLITTGEGGMIVTDNKKVADTIRSLKTFGYTNAKYDDIRAAIGIEQLKKLPAIIERRRDMARIYGELLTFVDGVNFPVWTSDTNHTFQTYAVYLKKGNRDAVIERLKHRRIETQRGAYYLPSSMKDENPFQPNSALLAQRLLALPMSHSITEEQQKIVVEELKKAI